jgi:hypothetical protein
MTYCRDASGTERLNLCSVARVPDHLCCATGGAGLESQPALTLFLVFGGRESERVFICGFMRPAVWFKLSNEFDRLGSCGSHDSRGRRG